MEQTSVRTLLQQVADGSVSVEEALLQLKKEPFEDLGFAKLDHHRKVRQGAAEVIYGAGKTPEQIVSIIQAFLKENEPRILITRMSKEAAEYVSKKVPLTYDAQSKVGIVGDMPEPDGNGKIAVVTAGTSDIPVAEEAALTAQIHGNEVVRIYDVGVAGIHRLFAHLDELMSAQVVIAIAGMEGALASVIGGLVDCPVIAVPTSVGYGVSLNGVTPLLAMLSSCASGVSVVNIDNGFGAGYLAGMINHLSGKDRK
jgi:NCAIR mutase (PurE)-related protein